jgi:hypothetical protein
MKKTTTIAAALGLMMACEAQAQLPPEWVGLWTGACRLDPPYQGASGFNASLEIKPAGDNRYTWILIYEFSNPPSRQVRNYELRPTETPNRYALDEKNGLEIIQVLSGKSLFGAYTIGGKLYGTTYSLRGDRIIMDVPSFAEDGARETCLSGNASMCVRSFEPSLVQACELVKSGR